MIKGLLAILFMLVIPALEAEAIVFVQGGGGGLDVLAAMDFEDSTSDTVCTDSQGGGWIGSITDSGSCRGTGLDSSTYAADVGAGNSAKVLDLQAFTERTTGWVTADFQITLDSNSATVENLGVFALVNDAGGGTCFIRYLPATPAVKIQLEGSASSALTIVDSTLYYMRIRFNLSDDDCYLTVSTSSYGADDVGARTQLGSGSNAVSGWHVRQAITGTLTPIFVDNIRICSGDNGTSNSSGCINL